MRLLLAGFLGLAVAAQAQTLINIDFGAGTTSPKTGMAAAGMGTNDYWNLYRHYEPKFTPGMMLVSNGRLDKVKFADGSESAVSIAVSNAPGVWGNSTGDAMYDTYIFSQDGSNITVTISGLPKGQYHFYLYGHAEPDVTGEQNSVFTLRAGTNSFGPMTQMGGSGWKSGNPWQERAQYVVFRDVPVNGKPVVIDVAPGPNSVPVLNGMQIVSRGTSPPRLLAAAPPKGPPASTNLLFHEIRYEGAVSDNEARFAVAFDVESMATNELSAPLFDGEVALVSPVLPEGLRIVSQGRQTRLFCATPGIHRVKLELIAKITRAEPWNQIAFTGPAAAIASVTATASTAGVEMQLLSGTQLEPEKKAASRLSGFLDAGRAVVMRWQSQAAEVTRKSLVTVDTAATAQITPTVVKFTTAFRYEILQSAIPRLVFELPATHALTRIQGEQIRDWQIKPDGANQLLTVEFIKPVEKSCAVTLFSEQAVEAAPLVTLLQPPQPMEVERESGSFSLQADDTVVEFDSTPGLRQVSASAGALAAYRFNGRPVSIGARLKRIEPVLKLADRVTARLEETRLLVSHALTLNVEKAGIYALDLAPQTGMAVSEVKGEGVDDWRVIDGKVRISFSSRVLGSRKINLQLEQANKEFPDKVTILPLMVAGATNITTQLGAGSSPGIRLKTAEVSGLREVPVNSLSERSDEVLAFTSEQADWKLSLAAERLAPRVLSDVFNLVTVGDGLVGGSATIRYGIVNQGVQQFRITVPAHWRNIEFTGANIRRKEQQTNVWTITLQDKAWGGYTLVLTYDYQFDPKGSTLDLAGAHTLDVERETGSLGLMTAASLKLTPAAPAEPLRRVDETELSENDRALCTRPLLLAYKYTGGGYRYSVEATRFEELAVLDAVADRIELTTVLTEEGQLLTQSSFMVKNNEKQFQKFRLPARAHFWSSYVNGQPAKPERDGDWFLVPLPRDANRDQAFAVDIVYAQTIDLKTVLFPHRVQLAAPLTDIPNTYAEWQVFVPVSQRLSKFGGNMTVARGTTYDLRDAWQEVVKFYGNLIDQNLGLLVFCFVAAGFVALLVVAYRRGLQSAVQVLVVVAIVAILGAMMLPALSRAKSRAQRISAMNNLKQIGLAARVWSQDNGATLPGNLAAMKNELGSEKILIDPNTGQPFIYVGAGKDTSHPEAIVAYSPSDVGGRSVLFADGSVQVMGPEKFQDALQRDAAVPRAVFSPNSPVPVAEGLASPPPASVAAAGPNEQPATEGTQANAPQPSPVYGAHGGGGGGGGAVFSAPQAKPTAAGVRPIRIDVPRTGQAFSFTKVLNAGQEPLTISVSMMRLNVYRTVQMVVQVCGFMLGLVLLWWLAVRSERSSFWMAVASALIIWSVASLLVMWRLLHVGLIAAIPVLLAGLIFWVASSIWRRRKAARASHPPIIPPGGAGSAPGASAALLVLLAIVGSACSALADGLEPSPIPNSVSILSATYTGMVADRVALFDATIQLSTTATNQIVPLFGDDVAIKSFTAPGDVKLVRDGLSVGVLLPGRTNVVLQFKLVAKLGGDVTRRQLAFGIPPALSSRVSLLLDEPEADVDFPTAVSFERAGANQQTRVDAVIGAAGRLEMNWTPRVKRAAEITATVFAQNTAVAAFGGGVMNTRAALDFQISQGELRQVRVQIPSGHRLLRVEGESIRVWELKDDTLVVDLLKGVAPNYNLTVETERVLDKLPASTKIEIPHALDVKRETGLVALRGSEELSLAVESAEELQRVDAEEFHRAASDKLEGIVSAFRFLKTDFSLRVRAETVQPQIEAAVRNSVRIGSESVRLSARIDYVIKRAGVFSLRLALPAGYRLETVAGDGVSQWAERVEGGERLLDVTLKERTIGSYTLAVVLARDYKEPPGTLPIAGVHPRDIQKLTGFVTVSTEHGVAAKTESFDGLTEVPFASVPGETAVSGGSALAYKFIAAAPAAQPGWSLTVVTEPVEPWVRAEIMNTITMTETLVSGRTLVKYSIANAPVKEFRVRVPGAFKNVEIGGPQIRRRDETNGEWRVELQSKVRGDYVLVVSWELPKDPGTNVVELEGVQALGVEREAGFAAVIARPPLQVADKSAAELLSKIDARELPEWPGRPDPATVLAYRYLRPGYKLSLDVRRYDEAEVLQALIDSAHFTTVVADDGQMMTEVSLSIRNNGRQHLEIELPSQASVWSAFVAGEPVRPSKRDGKLLLPLVRDAGSDAPVAVELTFVGTDTFPRYHGGVSLASPKFDMPMKNARWDLYLPPDYDYSGFRGSMSRVSDTITPVVQAYSLSEYNVQQRAQEDQKKADVQNELNEARESLRGGNLRQAITSLNRSKSKGLQNNQAGEQGNVLNDVELNLRKAQSSNLIQAQNGFLLDNAGRLGDQTLQWQNLQSALNEAPQQRPSAQAGQSPNLFLNYDAEIAGQQWDKLEKAQQVAVAKVAPLRVNLPTRGIHYSFTQVLQTEIRKPMTVQLFADNTKVPSWTNRITLGLLGFLALWLLMAFAPRRKA